jgi:hypothetical protein
MSVKDPRRRAVAERLHRFFAVLREQVAEGTDDLWQRVQTRLIANPEYTRGNQSN